MTRQRTVVVSGGGTGIGKAVVRAFAGRGDRVVILGRRQEVLESAANEICEDFGEGLASAVAADLSDPEAVEQALDQLPATVDVLVNNAGRRGATLRGVGLAAVAERWEEDFRGNVLPAVLLTEAVLPRLARPGGRIVTVSSVAALRGNGSYGAVKGALLSWNHSLAAQVGAEGITANVVIPGYVAGTEFFGAPPGPEELARRAGQTLVGRVGTPDDVAHAVLLLASPDAGYITGELLNCSGGTVLGR